MIRILTLSAVIVGTAPLHGQAAPTISGTVVDPSGAPLAGAEVLIGIHEVADPDARNACEAGGGMLELRRVVAGSDGRYEAPVPLHPESAEANCVWVRAVLSRGGEPRMMAEAVDLPLEDRPLQVDLVAEPVETPEHGPPMRPAADAELARAEVPGYAGIWISECDLVVAVTDVARYGDRARAHGEALLASRPFSTGCARDPRVRLTEVPYDAAELYEYRQRAGALFGLVGAESLAIRESENRVVVGFASPSAQRRAERTLATLDIPEDAIRLEAPETEPELIPFGPEEPLLGNPVAPRERVTRPVWAGGGVEILWLDQVGRDAVRVRAVDPATDAVREVMDRPIPGSIGPAGIRVSDDGRTAYFVVSGVTAAGPRAGHLYRVPVAGGPPERLVDDVGGFDFLVSADERRVAYVPWSEGRRVRHPIVLDLVSGERTPVPYDGVATPRLQSISPDGRRLLYLLAAVSRKEGPRLRLADVETDQVRDFLVAGDTRPYPPIAVRWADGEPRILVAEPGADGSGV